MGSLDAGAIQDDQDKVEKTKKKRKLIHGSGPRKRRAEEENPKKLKKSLKEVESQLPEPAQMTMRDIIRRAEAIERKKMKEDAAKKAVNGSGTAPVPNVQGRKGSGLPVSEEASVSSVMTPQVQIVDGRIVINQESLVIGAQASTRVDTETYRRVEENASKLNYHSYSNRGPSERWRTEDTELFYKALEQFGTDFELIQQLFPGRTRRQVKAKFKNEEKLHAVRLADALAHKAQDQSHHYRAIIDMLKPEGGAERDDDELLANFEPPSKAGQEAVADENGGAAEPVTKVKAGTPSKVIDNDVSSLLTEVLVTEKAEAESEVKEKAEADSEAKEKAEAKSEVKDKNKAEEQAKTVPDKSPPPRQSEVEPVLIVVSQKDATIASQPVETVSINPQKEAPSAPVPSRNPLLAYSKSTQSSNPLLRYTAKRTPLSSYQK